MLTRQHILAAVTAIDKGGAKGIAESLRRRTRDGRNALTVTPAQAKFVRDVAATPDREPLEHYAHPGFNLPAWPQVAVPDGKGEGGTVLKPADPTLTPSEIAWLGTLPRDPSQLAWADTREVLTMQARPLNKADRRLVDALAVPARTWHDENAALVDLRNAERPLPTLPASLLPALADAVAAEVPELTPSEAAGRAADLADKIGADRAADRDRWIRSADVTLQELSRQSAERAVVVK